VPDGARFMFVWGHCVPMYHVQVYRYIVGLEFWNLGFGFYVFAAREMCRLGFESGHW
jgi:hypothetical protein